MTRIYLFEFERGEAMRTKLNISRATVDRLPIYFRTLIQLRQGGIEVVSSEELGRRIGVSPEQIRKDLAAFGEFGKKGVGYYVQYLIEKIAEILGLNHQWRFCIVGLGHLGGALANYQNFIALGFKLTAIFDADPEKMGRVLNGITVEDPAHMKAIIKEREIQIGVVSVPSSKAQKVVDELVESGVRGIWNFAPVRISVPDHIKIVNEDLSIGFSALSYYLSHSE